MSPVESTVKSTSPPAGVLPTFLAQLVRRGKGEIRVHRRSPLDPDDGRARHVLNSFEVALAVLDVVA